MCWSLPTESVSSSSWRSSMEEMGLFLTSSTKAAGRGSPWNTWSYMNQCIRNKITLDCLRTWLWEKDMKPFLSIRRYKNTYLKFSQQRPFYMRQYRVYNQFLWGNGIRLSAISVSACVSVCLCSNCLVFFKVNTRNLTTKCTF